MASRYAVLSHFDPLPANASASQKFARALAEDMPPIIKMAHDSGDPQVIYHCPACGSGQVIARSDGTVACGFCKMCFTVQVQPRYPAFPQTIDGQPIQVPGMGPQWPGQDDDQTMQAQDAAEGVPVDPAAEESDNPFADGEEGAEDDDDAEEDDGGNPFAKKSYRTVSGVLVAHGDFLKHVALESARDRDTVLKVIRRKIGVK